MAAPQFPISVQQLYRPLAGVTLPDLPNSDVNSDEYKFWKLHISRCCKGFVADDGRYINGIQYFYNNIVRTDYYHPSLKREVKGQLPLWRDNDNEITSHFWNNLPRLLPNGKYCNARSHIEIKARRKGWTYLDLLACNLYIFVMMPGYGIGSAYIDDENQEAEREMFRQAWLNLPPIFRRWNGHELKILIDNKDKGEFFVGYRDPLTKKDVIHNIWLQKIVDPVNPGIFKGRTFRRINVVEAGKWKQQGLLKKFLSQNEDCLRFGADYVGSYSIGGTSDEIQGVETDYKAVYFDRKAFPFSRHMSNAVKVHASFFNIDTGTTDEAAALEYELSMRETKKDDYISSQTYIVENPLTEEEMFIPKAQYAYNTTLLQNQLQFIFYNLLDKDWLRGSLEPQLDLNGRETAYQFVENGQGEWKVHSKYGWPDPRFEDLVVAGIDDKFKNQNAAKIQKGSSKSAMVVKLRQHDFDAPSDRFIAHLETPSLDLNLTYYEFYKAMLYWNIKKTLYEYNHEAFIMFLKARNELKRLFYVDEQPGVVVTGKGGILKEVTMFGNIFMAAGRYKLIDSPEIVKGMMQWGGPENNDIASATHIVFKLEDLLKEQKVTLSGQDARSTSRFIIGAAQPESTRIIQLGIPQRKNVG